MFTLKSKAFTKKLVSTQFLIVFFVLIISTSCASKKTLLDPLQAGWKNKAVCELLEENRKIRVLKCTFPPKIGHEKHFHKAHFGYTLKGSKFRIKNGKGVREITVPTGTKFYNKGITWHEVLNIGDSTAVFLIIEPK